MKRLFLALWPVLLGPALAQTHLLRDRAERSLNRHAQPADIPQGWRADAAHVLKLQR